MTDKHCLSCMRNAQQELFCTYCEQKGFLKSGILGFVFFDTLFMSQAHQLTYEDPVFLKVFLALSTLSFIIAYAFRRLISALMRSVVFPVFGLLVLTELFFQLNQHVLQVAWIDIGHSYYWSELPLITFLMILFRVKPVLTNGLKFQQQDYESGSQAEAKSQAQSKKRQKMITEEHREIEEQDLLGL